MKKWNDFKIEENRGIIYKKYKHILNKVSTIDSETLMNLFKDYDDIFFEGDISRNISDLNYSLIFKTDNIHTFTTEGTCSNSICDYTITLPVSKIIVDSPKIVAGHSCVTDLDCLLRVMEHEMSHLIIFMFCSDIMDGVHGTLFQKFVKDHFNHTDYYHDIF